ncbi:uncharacterized protein LOC112552574 isoform X3 [Pogonomyrmex barbatus]|uniref:Uncharacterized protein LOC112552574 isoform X3 n=1 Tax=Pogonomyrmex barbatus TaxID=144034 RepID=A0A8N1S5C7_9HYME|nr:uncharacterized protein LOC112552574 isoform X3 [Pogonomyrmex barbatus]
MVFLCLRVAQYFIYFYFLSYIIFSVLSNSILKESSSRNKRVIPYIKDSYLVQARARFLSEKKEMLMTIQKEDEETEGKDQEAGMESLQEKNNFRVNDTCFCAPSGN